MQRKQLRVVVGGDIKRFDSVKLNGVEKIFYNLFRQYQKSIINSNRRMMKENYIQKSPDEKEGIMICKDLIRNKKSELLLCPKTWERYVINDDLQIDIIISENYLDIINHTYHYTIPICRKTHNIITNVFDGYVEKRRQELKERIFSNIKHSLNTIHEKVKKDLQETGLK